MGAPCQPSGTFLQTPRLLDIKQPGRSAASPHAHSLLHRYRTRPNGLLLQQLVRRT